MTEKEWLASENQDELLAYLARKRRPALMRKLRLFACACCRRIWPLLKDWRSERAVEVAEQYADGKATLKQLNRAAADAREVRKRRVNFRFGDRFEADLKRGTRQLARVEASVNAALIQWCTNKINVANAAWIAAMTADQCVRAVIGTFPELVGPGGTWRGRILSSWDDASLAKRRQQTRLLREIVGNPFRLPVLGRETLSPTVATLAQVAYEEREEDGSLEATHLAVLGDALEEAGCTSSELLSHLRQPGQHVRGCWALDLVLGK